MAKFFKGKEKQANVPSLQSCVEQLAIQVREDFDINLSPTKMLVEPSYRLTVLHELRTLEDAKINEQLDLITRLASVNSASQQTIGNNIVLSKSSLMVFLMAVLAFAGAAYMYATTQFSSPKSLNNTIDHTPVAQVIQPTIQEPLESRQQETSLDTAVAALPVSNPTLVFRLHGSNTIGEKLALALIEAFYKARGVQEYIWVQGNSSVERTMQFIENGEIKAVQLHAHGSGTAFKGMSSGIADIGMASRAVKPKELVQTKDSLGDLSRVGNEHIIGLDGLAVIVNQNSPIKNMSIATLAKIFSGEIRDWSQIGYAKGPIKVFARDENSGTWDTFKKLVLKKAGKSLSDLASRHESSSELSELVSQNEYSIGFIGLNYIGHNKALAITEGQNTTPIFPTKSTVSTEDYALSRRLYLYTPTAASNVVKDFAQFAIGSEGQDLVDSVGLISQNISLQTVYPMQGAPRSYNNYAEKGQRLSLNFRFNRGNGDLDNKGQRDMLRLIDFIESNPGRRVVLMGFSDSSGAKTKNLQLSYRRAKAVENELVARGIPVMSVEAYGEMLPVANNGTTSGRERNRRVEVWVI